MKPGYATTEFWLTFIAQLINALIQSGLIGDGTQLVKGLAFAAAALTTVVYAITRAHVKGKDTEAKAGEVLGPDPQGGYASVDALLMLGIACIAIGVVVSFGCAAFKSEAKHAAGDAVDCMKPKLLDSSRELASVLEKSVPAVLSDTGKVDRAGFKSLTRDLTSDAAGCAIATVIARLSKPRGQDSLASPLAVDAADLQNTWADVDRDQFGGRTFQVGDGR